MHEIAIKMPNSASSFISPPCNSLQACRLYCTLATMKGKTPHLIVSAKVVDLFKHPNAHKLKIAKVSDGLNSYQVVCGAQNIYKDMVTILAKEGAILPSGIKIEPTQLRGENSQGMLCSPLEILRNEETGLIDLPPQTKLGLSLSEFAPHELSSTPWYKYHRTQQDWLLGDKTIKIVTKLGQEERSEAPPQQGARLLSETYFDQEQCCYRYRNYSVFAQQPSS